MSLSNVKIRTIFALKKELKLSDEELYLHLNSVCKTDSISKLSEFQADQFIKSLRVTLYKTKPRRKQKTIRSGSNVIAIMTPDQRTYIEDLIQKVNSLGTYKLTLEGMSQRQFKKPANRLTRANAKALTEALKSMYERGNRNAKD